MEITFFSVVRYPTEKAYGITIFYTMQALEELGHKVSIISPDNLNSFGKMSTKRHYLNCLLYRLIKISNNKRINSKWVFILQRLTISRLSKYTIPNKTEILWTRDPLIGLFNFRRAICRKVVIEIHQPLNLIEKAMLKVIQFSKKLIIAPISIDLYNSLNDSKFYFDKNSIVMCPMGVPKPFFIKSDISSDQNLPFREFKIGYVGGAYSAGVDQNISSLISCIGEYNTKSDNTKSTLSIFGLEADILSSFQAKFRELIEAKILFLSVRQNHDNLLTELQKCNLFILPYPEGNFFKSRFPIKAMEYAALRRPILVTNTISHRNIFNDSEAWFYEPQNCGSLFNALIEINKNSSETNKKIQLAFNKSLNFTYLNRVENVLKLI